MCGGGWLHARVLCEWKDRCEVSAVHAGGNGEKEVKQSRRCRAPITAVRPGLRGGVPPQCSWPMKEDKGVVVAKGWRLSESFCDSDMCRP